MKRILLDNDQTSKGKEALYEIAVRIKEMKSQTEIHEPEQVRNIDKSSSSDSDSASSNKEIDFDSYLDTIEQAKVKRHRSENAAAVDIKNTRFQQDFFGALMEVEKFDRSSKVTVDEAIPAYPEIVKDVARAVTAMQPTQLPILPSPLTPHVTLLSPASSPLSTPLTWQCPTSLPPTPLKVCPHHLGFISQIEVKVDQPSGVVHVLPLGDAGFVGRRDPHFRVL
ncbi:hypothetical protein Hamer_G012413 [Homarus americanus]|uniref:Uncharacterized protein n=1 Tax=Homarus americanus TaxID=6706 RepID=A0A8J5MZS2_HOMAM|nr:hypothetical protein Hamer_G012413 [Homarus americanus]